MAYEIAFVGNPNVGKSAWINALSHADFKVGNWPGVTVEKKEAHVEWQGKSYHFIDLPGTYSLENTGNEERITARYLKQQHVDLIVNVVDATNLSRNLLLTLCLRDLQIPMVLIFNFMDEVEKYHMHIDITALSRRLHIPIVLASAYDETTYPFVEQAIQTGVAQKVFYHPLLTKEDDAIYVAIFTYLQKQLPPAIAQQEALVHLIALSYLQEDPLTLRQLVSWNVDGEALKQLRKGLTAQIFQQHRFETIASLMKCVKEDVHARYAKSRRMDAFLLHRIWGLPIFLALFSVLLMFVFQASAPFTGFITFLIQDMLSKYVEAACFFLPIALKQLLLQGILAGVGGVLSFVPLMTLLYFVLSFLEESGYMSRIAFLLDRLMHSFHLSGKSFVSLMLGFGCNVPAIYATRTLDNEKQKKLTALLVPFMSCGARLPVYVLFAAAFFPRKASILLLSVYGIGICMALLLALIASRFPSFHDEELFVLELPPYRWPSFRVVGHKVKEEVKGYVKKACGIVLLAMVILWGLTYFPHGKVEDSYLAQGAKQSAWLFEPLGFGDRWECVASLPGGIIAKETIVGFFDTLFSAPAASTPATIEPLSDLRLIGRHGIQAIQEAAGFFLHPQLQLQVESQQQVTHMQALWQDKRAPLKAFSFMVYVLLSIPCVMTLQALYHEYGWKLLGLSVLLMLVIPYLTSLCIYQVFSLFL